MDDVLIVGGGPAGAFAAAILAGAGLSVRVFDRARFPRDKLCGDTLNPGALRTLSARMPIEPIVMRGLPLDGMRLSGPGGVEVRGRYGRGRTGRSLPRRDLDLLLIQHAAARGARIEEAALVTAPLTGADGAVVGLIVKGRTGERRHHARLVIAADGRSSRLARAMALARHPRRPRRWAVGGYFEGVNDLGRLGEMHVRSDHYIGVAPMPDALANTCLVVPQATKRRDWTDPSALLLQAVRADRLLADRFARARLVAPPQVLGPMAVDANAAGVPGLLLAGDAAGFIDPMTGDGLRLAFTSAELAAAVAIDVINGRLSPPEAVASLARLRRAAFSRKWRFNRSLRALVGSAALLSGAAAAARFVPSAFEAIIRYAGDCT